LGAVDGEAWFYSREGEGGTNSLSEAHGGTASLVLTQSVDSFLELNHIHSVAMIKIDTEGFDHDVIQGSKSSLASSRIEVLQFEYNWRWLLNHRSLRDIFEFRDSVAPSYLIGRLLKQNIEYYESWHFELDRYFEGNYVLVRGDSRIAKLGYLVDFNSSNAPQSKWNGAAGDGN
jgi:hypothetical protein